VNETKRKKPKSIAIFQRCCISVFACSIKYEKKFWMTDLFNDGGVIKTVIRASNDDRNPVAGDEVALTYVITGQEDPHPKNLLYVIGSNSSELFIPLQTMDRIVCAMKRGERCGVRISPRYAGQSSALSVEFTLLHIRPGALTSLAPPPQSLSQYQDHLLQNPDVMEQMLSSPIMDSLLSNPDIMNSMIEGNPQMQELLERNPELRSMMRDPEFIQQSMEAMRNPSMMREMMRNTDRAMSNIESLPGGSAALHKLYNEVQAPLMDATAGGPMDSGKDEKVVNTKQLKAKYGDSMKLTKPVSEPMVNPWAPRQIPTIPSLAPVPSARDTFDMSAFASMMQNPAFQQMVNPPQASPPSLAQLFDPNSMQAMAQLERSLGMMGGQPSAGLDFNSLFGNFINAPSSVDPETRYRVQLATLRSMGFEDTQSAIRALDRTGGNVDRAVDILILERTGASGSSSKDSSSN